MEEASNVKVYPISEIQLDQFVGSFVSCLILNAKGQLLLQYRDPSFKSFGDRISPFGGKIEEEESPDEAIIRELSEELSIKPSLSQLRYLEALSESETKHKELIYTFFWHDTRKSKYKCTEGEIVTFNSAEEALQNPKLTQDARWLIQSCHELQWLD